MNASLGIAGIVLGLAASLGGVVTLGVGLHRGRPQLLAVGRTYAWMTFLGAVLAFAAMERALITRDFSTTPTMKPARSYSPSA